MPQQYYAAVTCSNCGTQFQTPVEQILDVRIDPNSKNRLLNGSVNLAVCPACGAGGRLNLPFIYHDPEQEVALLYLPMDAGRTEVERQKLAGTLNRQLMDALPQEERKGYLLQPETFINMETLIRRVLELEGVTEEDMARTQKQREFFQQLLGAPRDEWETLIQENDKMIDESLFTLLNYALQLASMSAGEAEEDAEPNEDLQHILDLQDYLVENHPLGQKLQQRTEVLQPFLENPTRETLVEALVQAQDEETVLMLTQSGLPLMDYGFFQSLVHHIEAAETQEEAERLRQLRRQILDVRDQIAEANQATARERADLLERLLNTEDKLKMARSHRSELDELFFLILRSELEEAQEQQNQGYFSALEKVAEAVESVVEESMPPELVLVRELLLATEPNDVEQILEQNRHLLQPRFFGLLENLEHDSLERGDNESAERLASLKVKAQRYAPQQASQPQGQRPQQPQQPDLSGSETQTPSGLIIAKR